jgi:hypothetical protein
VVLFENYSFEYNNMHMWGWMQVIVAQKRQKIHSLWVHTRFLKMIQMDMVVTLKNISNVICE